MGLMNGQVMRGENPLKEGLGEGTVRGLGG